MKAILPACLLLFSFTFFSKALSGQPLKKINMAAYSIQAPAGWTIDSSKQMGTDLILFSKKENDKDNFRENINVLIQNISGMHIDLQKYTAISEGQIKTMAQDGKLEVSQTIGTGSGLHQKVIYTATQNGAPLKFEQYYFVTANKAYVITLTTEVSTFDAFKTTGEQVLNSFTLRK